jgi:hypothetical protein
MKINGLSLLTTIPRNLMYQTTEWVPNQTSESYRSTLGKIFHIYTTWKDSKLRAYIRITVIRHY